MRVIHRSALAAMIAAVLLSSPNPSPANAGVRAVDDGDRTDQSEYARRMGTRSVDSSVTSNVVGGQTVAISEVPWQVALLSSDESSPYLAQFCGGTLIAPTWVVTAAHCVDGRAPWSIEVVAGSDQLTYAQATPRIPATAVYQHPAYESSGHRNDIALLQLSQAVTQGVRAQLPAGLDTSFWPTTGTQAVASGWGSVTSGGYSPVVLRRALVPVMASPGQGCGNYGGAFDPSTMLCAGATGVDTCQGDSGGPLVAIVGGAPVLAGVTSFGNGCGWSGYPGVYARVTTYLSWITSIVPTQDLSASMPGLADRPFPVADGDGFLAFSFTDDSDYDSWSLYGEMTGSMIAVVANAPLEVRVGLITDYYPSGGYFDSWGGQGIVAFDTDLDGAFDLAVTAPSGYFNLWQRRAAQVTGSASSRAGCSAAWERGDLIWRISVSMQCFGGAREIAYGTYLADGWGYDYSPYLSDPINISNAIRPSPPVVTGLTPGNRQVSVAVSPSERYPSWISSVLITAEPSGLSCRADPSTNSCTVTGLSNGVPYMFNARLTDALGDGLPSAWSSSAVPAPQVPVMRPRERLALRAVAQAAGIDAGPRATVRVKVAARSRKVCSVSGSRLKAHRSGLCSLTVSVKERGQRTVTRKLAITVS